MRANSWLYHYYTVQSKLQYGLGGGGAGGYETASQPAARPYPQYQEPAAAPQYHHQYHQQDYRYPREAEPVDYSLGSPASPDTEARPRTRLKAPDPPPPPDTIEQWNPSPPWSDTALQKVPDILHHEASPYLTTTPPTPSSAPPVLPHGQFTFEWGAGQHVPEEHPHLLPCFPWHPPPAEHRLFPLQPPPRPSLIIRLDHETHIHHHHHQTPIKDERHHEAYESVN